MHAYATSRLGSHSVNKLRLLLKLLRAVQPVSRTELAERLRIDKSTVTEIVRPLIDACVICETKVESGRQGRQARLQSKNSRRLSKVIFMVYSKLDLNGKTAVVIGGTSGIGRAIAQGLAEAGADVVCSSRRAEQVGASATEIEGLGRKTIRCVSDVADRASIEELLANTIRELGKVDILVNSAGITKRAPTLDFDETDWEAIFATNLTGTLRSCQVFGRHMIERGYGRIINIASLGSYVSLFEVAAYSASKAAVASLTKSLAIEWAKKGVNVNAIAPGVFKTALNKKLLEESQRGQEFLTRTPMGRFGKVEELAGAAVFLASDAASFVTGEVLVVDGGFLASGVNQ